MHQKRVEWCCLRPSQHHMDVQGIQTGSEIVICVGFLCIPMSFFLISQNCLPLWYVCKVPAHLNTCLRSSQQKQHEHSAFSEFCFIGLLTLPDSHYFASVGLLPCASNSISVLMSTWSLGTYWRLQVSDCSTPQPLGATSCNYPHNHHSAKHWWTALICSSFIFTAPLHTVSSATFHSPFFLEPIFSPIKIRLLCL